ncbi:TRAP transporter substrate-binding protein [Oceanobacter mangrovi]|uniref:TRAP transporter substrate-binding protein n=1 Tax=Oceanobacter mangrovi TaxID=2862510 RepID=UPI001FE73C20|nr:TRAP transporter substrate-binding protein [Oceanobacter mangrovi]
MKIKNLMVALGISLSGLTTAISAQAEAEYSFKLHHFLPPMSMVNKEIMEPWAEKIAKESNGRIKIDIYPAMQLGGKPPQLFDQARKGVADITWTVAGYTPGRFPKGSVFELPFMAASSDEVASMAMQEYGEKEMQKELSDVHVLALHTHSPGSLHGRDSLIKSMADLSDKKVRAPNKAMAEAFTNVGASALFMPVTQMTSALSKGIVDVAVLPFEVVAPFKIHELAPYHTEIKGDRGLYLQFFIFSMNKKAYEKLPADLQQVIDNNSGIELAQQIGQKYDKAELVARQVAVDNGNTFYTLPADETQHWKQAMQSVTDDWIDDMGSDGQRLYDEANQLIKKYQQQLQVGSL